MKKTIVLLVVVILVAIMVSSYIKQQIETNRALDSNVLGEEVDLATVEGLKQGQLAPDFTLRNLQGEKVTLSSLQGKNVVLNFWATWCVPCKAEMPDFQQYYKKYAKKQNVEIVAVNMTFSNDSPKKVQHFIETFDLTFPILLEPEQGASAQYEIITIPSTFIIDAEGKIQHYIKGPMNVDNLREYVDQVNS